MAAKANRIPEASHVPQASSESKIQPQANKHSSLEEQIRYRAHELYLQRGGAHGSDMDDWLQAEAEILNGEGTLSPPEHRSAPSELRSKASSL